MEEETFFAVLKFESFNKMHMYTKDKRFLNINLKTLLSYHLYYNKWVIIVNKQRDLQEIGSFMQEMFSATDIREYIITYPSISVRYTFNLSKVVYISIKFLDFLLENDKIGCLISENEGEKELEKIKEKIVDKDCVLECLLEISEGEEIYASTRFEGNLFKCVKFVYDFLEKRIDKHILYNLIYIDSDSDQLKTAFQNKLLMFVCESTANFSEKIYSVKFIPSPYFVSETSYIWECVENDAVAIGGLRIRKVFTEKGLDFCKNEGFYFKLTENDFLIEVFKDK